MADIIFNQSADLDLFKVKLSGSPFSIKILNLIFV